MKKIPLFFHNGSRFDNNLLIPIFQRYPGFFRPGKIIASNLEHFKSVEYGDFVLRDSYLLLNAGLEKLVNSLSSRVASDDTDSLWKEFPYTKRMLEQHYAHHNKFQLALKKGVFPYEYFDSLDRLNDKRLPDPIQFYSSLNGSHVTNKGYRHAKRVWRGFRCKSLRDYANFYVRTDTTLLMDVFTSSRNLLYQHYQLDLAHFVSLPSFAMNAALKITDVKLELIKDPVMLAMIDAGMIGGVSMVDTALFQANTPYLDDVKHNTSLLGRKRKRAAAYDPQKPKRDILSVDANALYGWAMSQPLPVSNFNWLTSQEIENMQKNDLELVKNYQDSNETAYFLKVDLDYPSALHQQHDTFPLAPEHLKIPFEQLAPFQQEYLLKNDMQHVTNHEKLIPNLHNKKEYVLHVKNLQQYLALGLVCTKIHSVISFKQAAWLKPYIDLNTRLRQEGANDPFAVAFFKLMNNIIYGKTIEDSSKYRTCKLLNNYDDYVKTVVRKEFVHAKLIENNSAIAELKSAMPASNKPRYLGVAVLAYAKHHLYNFHYNYVCKHFKHDEVRLLMTDTDSLCYGFTTHKNVPRTFKKHMSDIMDYSNYPRNHPWFDDSNKLVPGKWKEEWGGRTLSEFVGLKPKTYSILVGGFKPGQHKSTKKQKLAGKQTAKGIPFRHKEQHIFHEHYVSAIKQLKPVENDVTYRRIMSQNMEINVVEETRRGLNFFNDKKRIESITDMNHSFGYNPCQ